MQADRSEDRQRADAYEVELRSKAKLDPGNFWELIWFLGLPLEVRCSYMRILEARIDHASTRQHLFRQSCYHQRNWREDEVDFMVVEAVQPQPNRSWRSISRRETRKAIGYGRSPTNRSRARGAPRPEPSNSARPRRSRASTAGPIAPIQPRSSRKPRTVTKDPTRVKSPNSQAPVAARASKRRDSRVPPVSPAQEHVAQPHDELPPAPPTPTGLREAIRAIPNLSIHAAGYATDTLNDGRTSPMQPATPQGELVPGNLAFLVATGRFHMEPWTEQDALMPKVVHDVHTFERDHPGVLNTLEYLLFPRGLDYSTEAIPANRVIMDFVMGGAPGVGGPQGPPLLLLFLSSTCYRISLPSPPLQQAIGGFSKIIDTYEGVAKGNDECYVLCKQLDSLLGDLSSFLESATNPTMTMSMKNLAIGINEEVKLVERKHERGMIKRYVEVLENQEDVMESYRRIQSHLERLVLNANLSIWDIVDNQAMEGHLHQLLPAMSAAYNSAESEDVQRRPCASGTREQEIAALLTWAHANNTGDVYWINGMAGTGKTTIAYSLCDELEKTADLGASFFCSRLIPECRNVKLIIPAIAYQLARFSHPFRYALSRVLQADPDAHTRTLKTQFTNLIATPLSEVRTALPSNIVVVIDALDECKSDNSIGQILDVLLAHLGTSRILHGTI